MGQVDSTKPITVTTQFITADGTDTGKLKEVKQFYTQNGKTIEHPSYTVNGNQHKTITDDFCKDLESKQANAHVIFSDIKFGPIGSTVPHGPSPAPTPSPTPTPTPTPTPSPSDCPGSLDACIDLCPADVFAQCVE